MDRDSQDSEGLGARMGSERARASSPLDTPVPHSASPHLSSARGGRKPRGTPVPFEIVRELGPEDIPALLNPPTLESKPAVLRGALRHAHHQLAQLIAQGRPSAEIGLITGYSGSYITNIQDDPAFKELLAYYAAQQEDVFVDVLGKMRDVGLAAAEELQHRLNESPDKFANRELLEVIELNVVKPMNAVANARRGVDPNPDSRGGAQVINVQFVTAEPKLVTVEHEENNNG